MTDKRISPLQWLSTKFASLNHSHSEYLTQHQSLKTVNNESLVGTGNITIDSGSDIDIVTSWEQTLSDEKVASEKLVKESIDSVLYETEDITLGTPTTSSNVSYTYNYNDTDLTLTIPTLNTCQFSLSSDFSYKADKIGGLELIFEIVLPQTGDAMFKLGDDDGGVALFQTYNSSRWRRYFGYCNYQKVIKSVDKIYYYEYDYDLGGMINKENITISIQLKGNTSTIYFNDDLNNQLDIRYDYDYIQFSSNVSVNVYAKIPNFPIRLSKFFDDTKGIEELEDGADLNDLSLDKTYIGAVNERISISNCPVQNKSFVLINRNITPNNSGDYPNIQQILMTTSDGANTELWIRYHYQSFGYNGTWVKLATGNGSGGSVTVDSSWVSNSTNPVESQLIKSALDNKEQTSNKVTSISSSSTDTQYPSAKCVYDEVDSLWDNIPNTNDFELVQCKVNDISLYTSDTDMYPSTKAVADYIGNALPTNLSDLTDDINCVTTSSASSTTPLSDISGGSSGSSTNYARADHQHQLSDAYARSSHTHSNYVNPTIADNLTTNDSSQVLSAKQGKVLNDLIGQAISYINQ